MEKLQQDGNICGVFAKMLAKLEKMILAIFSSFVQTGLIWAVEKIKPDLSKISIIKGVKRLVSVRALVEFLKGKTLEEAKQVKDKQIAEILELPPIKLHCSVLAEGSIKKAIEDWERKVAHRKHNQT